MGQFLTNKLVSRFHGDARMAQMLRRREVMTAGRRRILVVEDDSETAEQLVESLASGGYQVDLAVNGEEGLGRGRSADYAVMTIDRMLPGMDGIAIIRRLREDGIA